MDPRHAIPALLVAALALLALPLAGAGEPQDPDHDIVDVSLSADADDLFLNVTVAGTVPATDPGQRSFRVNFTVRSAQERDAGADSGRRYVVALGEGSAADDYVLAERVDGQRVRATPLDPQPQPGSSTITFAVDRSDARAVPDDPLEEGDAVVDVEATFLRDGGAADREPGPDFVVPDLGLDADRTLYLAADRDAPLLRDRTLTPTAPTPARPQTGVVAADEGRTLRFTSAPLEEPLVLESGSVSLWLSYTTTTPNLALNAPNARLYVLTPDGDRALLAERESYVTPGANPNVFTTPGRPHEATWPLVFYRDEVPADARLQLEVRSQGLLGQGAQGPQVLYYNSTAYDSALHLDARTGPQPRVQATTPPLGSRILHLGGTRGNLTASPPDDEGAEATPAAGGGNTTLARWSTAPLESRLPLEDARATVWLSGTTASPIASLSYVDVRLYHLQGSQATLVAQRETVASGGNENVFTLPADPRKYTWPLRTYAEGVPAGDRLQVRVVAEALPGLAPTAALVWSNGTAMDSRILVDTGDVEAHASPDPAVVDEPVTFTADPPPGDAPFTVTWSFGDGTAATRTSDGGPVTVEHAYASTGDYTAVVNVRSAQGRAAGARVPVAVADPGNVTRLADVSASPYVPEVGTVRVTWTSDAPGNTTVRYGTSPDDLDAEVSIDESVTEHAVNLTGLTPGRTYHYRVRTEDVVSDVRNVTAAPDLTGDGHVVVATIDSGINPYHEAFRRPGRTAHPATYLTGFPESARPLDLTFSADSYWDAVQADQEVWSRIQLATTYWVPGTNLFVRDQGDVSFATAGTDEKPILDEVGHGTNVAGAVNQAFPGATILAVESTRNGALEWAASQPWVDVISLSYSGPASGPFAPVSDGIQAAREHGKMLVVSAGNNPTPHVLFRPNGPPQAISVGGAHPDDRADAFVTSKGPDVVSNFTLQGLPQAQTLEARGSAVGTSFSAPNVAGTLAHAIERLRRRAGDTNESTRDGLVEVPPAMAQAPYLGDGVLDSGELRSAMNRSARYWSTTGYDPTSPLARPFSAPAPVAPAAPWVQQGWGFVGPSMADRVAGAAAGEIHPTKSAAARAYMTANHEARQAYHQGGMGAVHERTLLNPVSAPGPPAGVETLANPVETPHPYPNDAVLQYVVHREGAAAISLHFEEFSVETSYDRLDVRDGDGDRLATYSLEGRASFWTPYFPAEKLRLLLFTDPVERRHGFVVEEVDAVS